MNNHAGRIGRAGRESNVRPIGRHHIHARRDFAAEDGRVFRGIVTHVVQIRRRVELLV